MFRGIQIRKDMNNIDEDEEMENTTITKPQKASKSSELNKLKAQFEKTRSLQKMSRLIKTTGKKE